MPVFYFPVSYPFFPDMNYSSFIVALKESNCLLGLWVAVDLFGSSPPVLKDYVMNVSVWLFFALSLRLLVLRIDVMSFPGFTKIL